MKIKIKLTNKLTIDRKTLEERRFNDRNNEIDIALGRPAWDKIRTDRELANQRVI